MSDSSFVAAAKRGDNRAFDRLARQYHPLMVSIARNFFLPGNSRDDVDFEARVGLWLAVRDYDSTIGDFAGFARYVIRRHLVSCLTAACRAKCRPLSEALSLDAAIKTGDEGDTFLDLCAGAEPSPEAIHFRERNTAVIERFLDKMLSYRERVVMDEFVSGQSLREIAVTLGIEVKFVDNAMMRARRKIAARLLDPDAEFHRIDIRLTELDRRDMATKLRNLEVTHARFL